MTLYPWHKCDQGCLWWGAGDKIDCCNLENIVVEADTGRPGCRYWVCASCGVGWDGEDEPDHSACLIIEVELEIDAV